MEERKRRRVKAAPDRGGAMPGEGISPLSIFILIICYAIVGGLGYMIYHQKIEDQRSLERLQEESKDYKDKIKKIKQKYTYISRLKNLTENQLEILKALDPEDRLLWSEKINMLAELIPDGVYLTQIQVKEDIREVETAESKRRLREWERKGKKGKRPTPIKKPVITQHLYLDGVSRAELPEDRLRLISAFSEALQDFQWKSDKGEIHKFYDHFRGEIDPSEMNVIKIERISVTKFRFHMRSKPFGE
jgi:hypothetical protein